MPLDAPCREVTPPAVKRFWTFFSHAISYFCWLIFLTLLTVFESSKFPRSRGLLAISPSLFLMAIYLLHRDHAAGGSAAAWFAFDPRAKLRVFSIFSPLHVFEPFYWSDPKPLRLFAAAFNLSVIMLVLILVVIWARSLFRRSSWFGSQNGGARAVAVAPLVFLSYSSWRRSQRPPEHTT